MLLNIVSCGIFMSELNKIIPSLRREMRMKGHEIKVDFLSPGLHIDSNKMETEVIKNLESKKGTKILLLYGRMCHTKLVSIAKGYNAAVPTEKNCIELLLGPEKKKALDGSGHIFYLTAGWLQCWREMFQDRTAITPCDKMVMLDTGENLISEEELLDFYDFMQVPIETVGISLDDFKSKLTSMCTYTLENN
jgi:hypothetical protein